MLNRWQRGLKYSERSKDLDLICRQGEIEEVTFKKSDKDKKRSRPFLRVSRGELLR